MAKKSMIARDVKRKKLVERYAAKRKSLIDAFKSAKDPMERLEIVVGLLGNQEGFIEILAYAEINLDRELITGNCLE